MSLVAERKLRSPVKWHGGKAYLARRIVALMPEHETYAEPFFGGGNVLLNKQPAVREVAGDANPRLIEFWRVLQEVPKLQAAIEQTSYTVEEFMRAAVCLESSDLASRSWAFLVRNRMSRGGLGRSFAWSAAVSAARSAESAAESAWSAESAVAWETMAADLLRLLAACK